MIDVKEAKDPMEEASEALRKYDEMVFKRMRENSVYGLAAPGTFRDPAEMVTISATRFESLIRASEIQKNEINDLREKLGKAWGFINTVAMEWAQRGQQIPTYEDMFRMSEILDWHEPDGIRRTRERIAAEKEAAKKEKEAANNGEAAD